MNNPFLATFENQPAMISLGTEARFKAFLDKAVSTLDTIEANTSPVTMQDEFWPTADSWMSAYRPYVVKSGILMIPVKGVLLNDFGYALGNWATGYTYIAKAFDRGLADPEVKGIAFVIDSGGGAVAGNFDLVDRIYGARGQKPTRAFASEHAYSAAYSIASAADNIVVSRTGGVGSIGVVTSHFDMSKRVEAEGYKVTFIHFGKHKVDGNSYEALPPEVKERIQGRIDTLGQVFVSTVARNRGMKEKAVRDTEALTFTADEALSNGLADSIGSLEDAIVAFATDLSKTEDDNMFTQEQLDAAVATATASAKEEGKNEGMNAGVAQERARVSAIVTSEAGAARPKAAMKMALNEKFAALDADAIVELLAELPEEKAEAPAPAAAEVPKGKDGAAADFKTAMDKAEHPQAGAPGEKQPDKSSARAAAALGAIGVNYKQ
ncbi:S49 family peptidase [Aquamicrobium zhengzhouense]|uniref:S49 family peptidase n=1 Tax=Aquamicrobium zhengzhouense TaxID=2781738 RepID=A0ABS0S9P2_9HYPH|nr:S49 family peptidase [Aquamicrobium zhengzhouense]MBI1620010.1 S49 family peptidase [Aquamicrobium zhengzhouense]